MTLDEIRKSVGRKCSLLDGSGNFVDGLILEADLTAMANERWRYLHLKYANKFPEALTVDVFADLVDGEGTYPLGTTDLTEFDLVYVGIKYASTDTSYRRVIPRSHKSLFTESTDKTKFTKNSPYYYILPADIVAPATHISQRAIEIVPTPDAAVENGLMYRMVELPTAMSAEADTPYTLPSIMHELIVDYMVADVWQIKRDWANSNEAMGRATYNERRFFDEYQISSSDVPIKIETSRRFTPNIR